MRRLKRVLSLGLVCVLCLTALIGCLPVNQSKPFDAVERYVDACNRLDYNALIECMDPRITDMLFGVLGAFGEETTGIDGFEDIAKSLTPMAGDLMGDYAQRSYAASDFAYTISVREIESVMNGADNAKVTAEFYFESSDGQTQTWQDTMSTVRIDGVWYLTIDMGFLGELGSLFG